MEIEIENLKFKNLDIYVDLLFPSWSVRLSGQRKWGEKCYARKRKGEKKKGNEKKKKKLKIGNEKMKKERFYIEKLAWLGCHSFYCPLRMNFAGVAAKRGGVKLSWNRAWKINENGIFEK